MVIDHRVPPAKNNANQAHNECHAHAMSIFGVLFLVTQSTKSAQNEQHVSSFCADLDRVATY